MRHEQCCVVDQTVTPVTETFVAKIPEMIIRTGRHKETWFPAIYKGEDTGKEHDLLVTYDDQACNY